MENLPAKRRKSPMEPSLKKKNPNASQPLQYVLRPPQVQNLLNSSPYLKK